MNSKTIQKCIEINYEIIIMNFGLYVYARMSSSRLPGKVLMPLGNKSIIENIFSKLENIGGNIKVILVTSDQKEDDILEDTATKNNICCVRGCLLNIAERTVKAIKSYDVDYFFRINGDSPFIQPNIIQECIKIIEDERPDFLTNLLPRHFPYGISVESIKCQTFIDNYKYINNSSKYCEHITTYFYDNLYKFKLSKYYKKDIFNPELHLTIDSEIDYKKISDKLINYPSLLDADIYTLINIFQAKI